MQPRHHLFAILLAGSLLTGCAEAPPASPQAQVNTNALASPLNSPVAAAPPTPVINVLPTPTQDATIGRVRGRLFVKQNGRNIPMRDVVVFLGPIVRDAVKGAEGVVSLDQVNAPKAVVGSDGTFEIPNVPPGRYGLVADIDDRMVLLNNPSDGSAFIQEIKSNEVIDLADLIYNDLPYIARP